MFLCLTGQWTALAERGAAYWDERARRKKAAKEAKARAAATRRWVAAPASEVCQPLTLLISLLYLFSFQYTDV